MGEVVGAALLAHVPTIVLPDEVRRGLNNGKESTLYSGLHDLRTVTDELAADLVIVFDSHWFTTVEFVITSAKRRSGFYTSDELPRGMSSVPYDMVGDPDFANLVGQIAEETPECWITPIDNPHLPAAYATLNFLPFLQRGDEAWVSVSTCQTSTPSDFAVVGQVIGEAIRQSDRRVMLIASGALSHTFHNLRDLRAHEAAGEEHIHTPEAAAFDHRVIDALERGDHRQVIEEMPQFQAFKPEGRFGHYLMMVHAIGGANCVAPGRRFSDYENSIGTGQVHVYFERPATGWMGTAQ